jgi:predicted ATPase
MSLAQGLAETDRRAEAIALMDETIGLCAANGDLVYMPELLRVKGDLLLAGATRGDKEAEPCFRQSLEWSRRQGARAWELRTAVDYASLLAARGDADGARALLQPALEPFAEGSDTADMKSAARLLAAL